MFGIKFDTWQSICNMYFSLSSGSQKAYLQWFPFTKLRKSDREFIKSEEFYNRYVNTASFILFPHVMQQSENFMQKGDGSFRDSSLVSPLLYLVLQAIGKEIYENYTTMYRPSGVSVYYAGNYEHMRPKYKQDYDAFFKELNSCIDEYQYFIKTDLTNFFANINIDTLIDQIDTVCNSEKVIFSQTQLQLFKELIKYCGNEKFPLIESSIASSYLSTVVYLNKVDARFHEYITEKVPMFSEFRMVRYVDDMYILISSTQSIDFLQEAYNEIRNEYSSILKDFGLALNTKKCCLKETREINQELKKSLYDEHFNEQKHSIEDLFSGSLQNFLDDLFITLLLDRIDIEKYNALIEKHFSSEDIEFVPSEVLNYFVYENNTALQREEVIERICSLVKQSISFISLDPKRLTIMIMKTKNEKAIKGFLNQLFKRYRADKWNSYDTTIAISYLIQSEFKHIDLLEILYQQHPELYRYYFYNCKSSFMNCLTSEKVNKICEVINKDKKAYYLYFMHLCEMKRKNYMAAFAYFKNFFDRITADLEFAFCRDPQMKRPNYKAFYKEKKLIDFYSAIADSRIIIETAHKLRNANPLSHSSSELLDNENTAADLKQSIEDLFGLIYEFIGTQKD